MEVVFLSKEDVLEIHAQQIKEFGGIHGLRDEALLESAIAMPQWYDSPAERAAAYMYHLTQNHPFLDGNKRIGTATALTFLVLNGYDIIVSPGELEAFAWDLAAGKKTKIEVIAFFQKYVVLV